MIYKAVYADPPWRFENWSMEAKAVKGEQWGRSVGRPVYDCMDTEDICALPVADLCHRDALLFLWATGPKMEDAFRVMKAWGFTYRAFVFTWAKLTPRAFDNWRKWQRDGMDPEEMVMRLYHAGNGYWCLGGETTVYICHRETGRVEAIEMKNLVLRDPSRYLVHTHTGWKRLKAAWMDSIRPTVDLHHRLGVTRCTLDHRWAVKRLSMPRAADGSRRREHLIEYLTVEKLDELSKKGTYASGGASANLLFSTYPIESPSPTREREGIQLDYDCGWLIGLYIAEGNCQKNQIRYTLGFGEEEHIDRLAMIVDRWELFHERYFRRRVQVHRYKQKTKNCYAVYFASSAIRRLIQHFVFGASAATKSLNLSELLQTSVEFRQGIVDGYLLGDGTKNKEAYAGYRGFRRVSSASHQLIADIQEVMLTLGAMSTQCLRIATGKFSPPEGSMAYTLDLPSPRNKALRLDGETVIPVRYDGYETRIAEPTYHLSVEGEVFVADGLISHNTMANAEFVLLGKRKGGKPKRINKDVRSLVVSPVGNHSAKPPEIRTRIERLLGDVPRIELFARPPVPAPWKALGLEIDGMDIQDAIPAHLAELQRAAAVPSWGL